MEKCTKECLYTTEITSTGIRLMIGVGGRFKEREVHPQCADCLRRLLEEAAMVKPE